MVRDKVNSELIFFSSRISKNIVHSTLTRTITPLFAAILRTSVKSSSNVSNATAVHVHTYIRDKDYRSRLQEASAEIKLGN